MAPQAPGTEAQSSAEATESPAFRSTPSVLRLPCSTRTPRTHSSLHGRKEMGRPQRFMGLLAWLVAVTFSAAELSVPSLRPQGQSAWVLGSRTRRARGGDYVCPDPPKQPQRNPEDRAESELHQQRHRQEEGLMGPLRPRHESGFQERGGTLQQGDGKTAIGPCEGITVAGRSPYRTPASRCRCRHNGKCRISWRCPHGKFGRGPDVRLLAHRRRRIRCQGAPPASTRGPACRTPCRTSAGVGHASRPRLENDDDCPCHAAFLFCGWEPERLFLWPSGFSVVVDATSCSAWRYGLWLCGLCKWCCVPRSVPGLTWAHWREGDRACCVTLGPGQSIPGAYSPAWCFGGSGGSKTCSQSCGQPLWGTVPASPPLGLFAATIQQEGQFLRSSRTTTSCQLPPTQVAWRLARDQAPMA